MGTMCTVTENNRLLSDFIGWKLDEEFESYMVPINFIVNGDFKEWAPTKHVDDIEYYILTDSQMEFHRDWNWLMEVVDRINNTGRFEVVIQKGFCYVSDESNELTLSCPASNTLEAVYQAVVEFIKWYN